MKAPSAPPALPPPPAIEVERLKERLEEGAFLRLRRLTLRNRYEDGQRSAPYAYDVVEREATDAVVFALFDARAEEPTICLRSALRPPLSLRAGYALPFPEPEPEACLWELPAGLIEPGEVGEEGLRACASRECLEEVGLHVPPERFLSLGPPVFVSPGVIAERLHFLCARVEPEARGEPTEDGSPVEERAALLFIPLRRALEAARRGLLSDLKSELALRRLAEHLESGEGRER